MCSDDAEHTIISAQAELCARGDVGAFEREMARRLRWWLLGLPVGVGRATLRACVRLWLGFGSQRSGVRSAGNGPAMRAAVIAAFGGPDGLSDERLRDVVRASSRITHTDPLAQDAALAVALAARKALQGDERLADRAGTAELIGEIARAMSEPQVRQALARVAETAARGATVREFSREFGFERRGVSGFAVHTVAAALFCWARAPYDFERGVREIIEMGGDTDSTAAIVGSLIGASVGVGGIPVAWRSGILEWPWSVRRMKRLAAELALGGESSTATCVMSPAAAWALSLPRNLLFASVVLLHGLRRLVRF